MENRRGTSPAVDSGRFAPSPVRLPMSSAPLLTGKWARAHNTVPVSFPSSVGRLGRLPAWPRAPWLG
jgi:hypothetical protein